MSDYLIETDDVPSKSQLKRESQQLLDLGAQLVGMPNNQLQKFDLDESLRTAIYEAKRLKNHDAKRRQIRYIGKLMRNLDLTGIEQALEKLNHQPQTYRQHFAKLEQWRDRLIHEGDSAIEELISLYPNADRQQLRSLQRQASREIKLNKPSTASEKLFKYLKQLAD
jgi:ribosome-associated protein